MPEAKTGRSGGSAGRERDRRPDFCSFGHLRSPFRALETPQMHVIKPLTGLILSGGLALMNHAGLESIVEHLDEIEDVNLAGLRSGESEAVLLEEVLKRYGMDNQA